jgi:hypothetical protein
MDSNYEWQKYAANKRIDSYRHEAEAERQVKQAGSQDRGEGVSLVKAGFALLIGLFLLAVGLFLSSCQAGEVPTAAASGESPNQRTMAERIRFQDQLEANFNESDMIELTPGKNRSGMTMADRIRFQDRLWERYGVEYPGVEGVSPQTVLGRGSNWRLQHRVSEPEPENGLPQVSMAERIRFQDRREQQP